jgi:hypothetical protein
MILDRIEYWHNRASDTNFVWFPFLFLKLKPAQQMGVGRRIIMTLCFAVYFTIWVIIRHLIFGTGINLAQTGTSFLYSFAAFFIWFNFVTATFWNRRSQRLIRLKGTK